MADSNVLKPEPPKRALSAYTYFCLEWRERIMQMPDASSASVDVASLLADLWGNLSSGDRLVYRQIALADLVRFEKERAQYEGYKGHSFLRFRRTRIRFPRPY
ncbi:hypothetical protein GGX14DRAFT_448751 [Mycena pura]|uniref:HMG box domain-containing protein n=1 Tax=Mycena pura TaxID=153505 RepID=A0AAD6VGR3_9AGAR|nr:hypothetical protein GGX14DRAFT_448751 [Mycena pura]